MSNDCFICEKKNISPYFQPKKKMCSMVDRYFIAPIPVRELETGKLISFPIFTDTNGDQWKIVCAVTPDGPRLFIRMLPHMEDQIAIQKNHSTIFQATYQLLKNIMHSDLVAIITDYASESFVYGGAGLPNRNFVCTIDSWSPGTFDQTFTRKHLLHEPLSFDLTPFLPPLDHAFVSPIGFLVFRVQIDCKNLDPQEKTWKNFDESLLTSCKWLFLAFGMRVLESMQFLTQVQYLFLNRTSPLSFLELLKSYPSGLLQSLPLEIVSSIIVFIVLSTEFRDFLKKKVSERFSNFIVLLLISFSFILEVPMTWNTLSQWQSQNSIPVLSFFLLLPLGVNFLFASIVGILHAFVKYWIGKQIDKIKYLQPLEYRLYFLIGEYQSLAWLFSILFIFPLEVLYRHNIAFPYQNHFDLAHDIYQKGGLSAFFSGITYYIMARVYKRRLTSGFEAMEQFASKTRLQKRNRKPWKLPLFRMLLALSFVAYFLFLF